VLSLKPVKIKRKIEKGNDMDNHQIKLGDKEKKMEH